jgi:hypothetical protein
MQHSNGSGAFPTRHHKYTPPPRCPYLINNKTMTNRPALPSSRRVTTDNEIVYILGMHDAGAQPVDIADRVGKHHTTIDRVTTTYDWETWSGRLKPNSRPRRTTSRDDRMLVRAALNNRRVVLGDITNDLAINISPRTVQCRLSEAGIQKHIAVAKPFLSAAHMKARLDWAMDH